MGLANYRKNMPSDQGQNTHSWMNYLQGEYKRVAPATSINREREVLQEANALADLSKDQVARATEIARMEAMKDQSKHKAIHAARLNLSSYGYTTGCETTDFSDNYYTENETDAVTCEEASSDESDDSLKANKFVAMYRFQGADEDELNFEAGDIITECQAIGDGWVYGVNETTGDAGMLPMNYLESMNC